MLLQQNPQNPIVVEVTQQPEATPEISYVGVLGTAGLMVIVILAVAMLAGLVLGGTFIWRKKRGASSGNDGSAPSHVRLQI
jgi:hypothetical protein